MNYQSIKNKILAQYTVSLAVLNLFLFITSWLINLDNMTINFQCYNHIRCSKNVNIYARMFAYFPK
ncbi:hypothetical protein DERF_008956 [Dermatophagoides farinae]|uniref:Uncharacterized protein n=1 Tax=Dermatophagoides farinae TaxID=6954 RepID=A0A922KR98_DERFA|nr:hypothetical protein DERF_016672 [Dermatophagoides farinae]KAH9510437.1 hypothetical protein DERF_008956 [Dermatophagoides farinae]